MSLNLRRKWKIGNNNSLNHRDGSKKTSKTIGTRINHIIPPKVHTVITTTIKSIVRTALFGAEYTPRRSVQHGLDLETADEEAKELFNLYQKIAVAEGAGTGAGGIMFSMVDFPALIGIKMKYLFETAHVYGYDTKQFSERIFILKLFQMTYSGAENRARLLDSIKHWHIEKEQWISDADYSKNMDWDSFQKEYEMRLIFEKCCKWYLGSVLSQGPGRTIRSLRSSVNSLWMLTDCAGYMMMLRMGSLQTMVNQYK